MNPILRTTLAAATLVLATQATAQVTFYESDAFQGRSFTTERQVNNFERFGFNDRASSVVVFTERWEVCDDARFRGNCVVLRPGRYSSLAAMGMNDRVSSVRPIPRNERVAERRFAPVPATAQVTFYESDGFRGRSFTTDSALNNFARSEFNDRASSIVVSGTPWEVCENAGYSGRCVVLRPGQYPNLASMGLNDRVSSVRPLGREARINDERNNRPQNIGQDYRRRNNERVYEANVTSVRAVVGTPEQHCWIEKEQVPQERSGANIPGGIAGALLGGILGHQVGGGRGQDIATIGGAVAGGAIGAQVGRNSGVSTQDVQRCQTVPSTARTQFWDVTYEFRGQQHAVQMTAPPGPTVTVNERGEPRG